MPPQIVEDLPKHVLEVRILGTMQIALSIDVRIESRTTLRRGSDSTKAYGIPAAFGRYDIDSLMTDPTLFMARSERSLFLKRILCRPEFESVL